MAVSMLARVSSLSLACACAATLATVPSQAPSGPVTAALERVPWDSLCISTQHLPCRVIRLDSAVRRMRLPIIESGDSVALVLRTDSCLALATRLGKRIERVGFGLRLPSADTLDVTAALLGAWTDTSSHVVMSILLPADSSGIYAHAELRRVRGTWSVVRRWIIEG